VNLVQHAQTHGGRVIAVGTTVVRALEHAAAADSELRSGEGLAAQRIGPETNLRVVDAILSGRTSREPATTNYCTHS
jgi:S-adenosylmethionine:tRNA ribosyltransferase-isomerase